MNLAAKIDKMVSTCARRYARMCWWADEEDLKQEGHCAAADAMTRWDAQVGVAPEQYFWPAIERSIRRALWTASSPVSGGSHRPRKSYAGLTRAGLVHASDAPARDRPADEALDESMWRRRVRARLLRLSHEVGQGTQAAGRAHRVLLGEIAAGKLAGLLQLKPSTVYGWTAKLRAAALRDEKLSELLRDRRD